MEKFERPIYDEIECKLRKIVKNLINTLHYRGYRNRIFLETIEKKYWLQRDA